MNSETRKIDKELRPSPTWLAAGALAGLVMAAWGLLEQAPAPGLPPGAVARIGDTLISRERFDREVERLEATGTGSVTRDDRQRLIEGLVQEELLFRRGVELGLVESDSTVRSAVIQSLVASVTADADAADPSVEQLRLFLEDNAERYTYASALALEAWTTGDESAARTFLAQLDGAEAPLADPALAPIAGLPEGPVPLERLRMFVGPAIAAAAADMAVGASAIFIRQGRWHVIRVADREVGAVADLDSVRSQVLIDYRRELANSQLSEYLDGLRRRASIVVALPE